MPKTYKDSEQPLYKKEFLKFFEMTYDAKASAQCAKINWQTYYNWLKSDNEFASDVAKIKANAQHLFLKDYMCVAKDLNSEKMMIRLLNSVLFKDSEYALYKDVDSIMENIDKDTEITFKLK